MTVAGPIIMMLICKCKKDRQKKVVVNIPWLNEPVVLYLYHRNDWSGTSNQRSNEVLVSPWQSYQDMQLPKILDGAEYRQIVESYRLYDSHFFFMGEPRKQHVPICKPKVICPAIFWMFDVDFRRCRTATSNGDIGKGEKAGRLGTHIFGGENGRLRKHGSAKPWICMRFTVPILLDFTMPGSMTSF